MASNHKLTENLTEIRSITGLKNACVLPVGTVISDNDDLMEKASHYLEGFKASEQDVMEADGLLLFKVLVDGDPEYIYVQENGKDSLAYGRMAVMQLRNLAEGAREQLDRNRFMQNLLLRNMLPVDAAAKARKLHIDNKPRAAFVIDTGKKTTDIVLELVKNLYNMKSADFATPVDSHRIALIKDMSGVSEDSLEEEMEAIAMLLVDSIHMDAMIKVRVGYGNLAETVDTIAESYQEACLALEVGRVFYAGRDTISYGRLGIGRLIHQLPVNLCQMFIKEVFGDQLPEILEDEEAMTIITRFFENSLNISETARQLYMHRNTLVYRLERIQRAIGLDIRNFDDALTFRIAVMVLAHLKDNN